MKQYARIFRYLSDYKGKILVYFLFTLLSILFSIVSIGMLMPFLQLIFLGGRNITGAGNNQVIGFVNDLLNRLSEKNDPVVMLSYICILMLFFIIFKNLFLYLSLYILNPLKHK